MIRASSLAKRSGVVEIGDADTVDPADLITVTRTDAPSRRPQMVGDGGRFLGQPFLGQVIRQDDMGSIADVESLTDIDTLAGKRSDLLEQSGRVDHHAVANDAIDTLPENSSRHQRKLVSRSADNDRVACIRPSLVANDDVVLVAEQVDDLSLAPHLPTEDPPRTSNPQRYLSQFIQSTVEGHLVR